MSFLLQPFVVSSFRRIVRRQLFVLLIFCHICIGRVLESRKPRIHRCNALAIRRTIRTIETICARDIRHIDFYLETNPPPELKSNFVPTKKIRCGVNTIRRVMRWSTCRHRCNRSIPDGIVPVPLCRPDSPTKQMLDIHRVSMMRRKVKLGDAMYDGYYSVYHVR